MKKIFSKLFLPRKLKLSNGKEVLEYPSKTPLIILLLVIAIVVSVRITGFNLMTLIERGKQFFTIIGQMFPPKWDYINKIWTPLFDTIKMSKSS